MALRSMPTVANRRFYGDPALSAGFRWNSTSSSDRFVICFSICQLAIDTSIVLPENSNQQAWCQRLGSNRLVYDPTIYDADGVSAQSHQRGIHALILCGI